ncbi:uncharacterized protein [Euphorbia lathyris]|uniref:uncharacterized protein isoform X4 n=1 Tax=Euphorbia lathyris TaxID=212925 RepID=UPI003313356F
MHFPDSTNHFRRLEAFPFSSVFADRQISFRVMKRRRKSTASNANGAGKVSHIQINYSGPSFSDLPNTILVLNHLMNLLSRCGELKLHKEEKAKCGGMGTRS